MASTHRLPAPRRRQPRPRSAAPTRIGTCDCRSRHELPIPAEPADPSSTPAGAHPMRRSATCHPRSCSVRNVVRTGRRLRRPRVLVSVEKTEEPAEGAPTAGHAGQAWAARTCPAGSPGDERSSRAYPDRQRPYRCPRPADPGRRPRREAVCGSPSPRTRRAASSSRSSPPRSPTTRSWRTARRRCSWSPPRPRPREPHARHGPERAGTGVRPDAAGLTGRSRRSRRTISTTRPPPPGASSVPRRAARSGGRPVVVSTGVRGPLDRGATGVRGQAAGPTIHDPPSTAAPTVTTRNTRPRTGRAGG